MKTICTTCLLLLIFSLPSISHAFVAGPSNFTSFNGYPEADCYQPSPPLTNDSFAWSMFKNEIESYKLCIQDYIDAAQNDQERIRESVNRSIDSYNTFIQSLQ